MGFRKITKEMMLAGCRRALRAILKRPEGTDLIPDGILNAFTTDEMEKTYHVDDVFESDTESS